MFQEVVTQMQKTWDAFRDSVRLPVGVVESVVREMAHSRASTVTRLEELTEKWACSTKQSLSLGASMVDSWQTLWTEWLAPSHGQPSKPS